MYNGKDETTRETLERVMREYGYLQEPVKLQTEIGDFTWYKDRKKPTLPENNNVLINQDNIKTMTNNYLVPKEVYTDPNWGQQTAAKLDEYMQNYNSYPGVTHTGVAAPFYDMWRNYKTMRDEQNWTGGDNFFHCKANYEAAKRGIWGEIAGKAVSAGREIWGQLKGDPLSDLRKDWHANSMGWNGAKKGLSLQQACPTNPKAYVNPDDYDDIF